MTLIITGRARTPIPCANPACDGGVVPRVGGHPFDLDDCPDCGGTEHLRCPCGEAATIEAYDPREGTVALCGACAKGDG